MGSNCSDECPGGEWQQGPLNQDTKGEALDLLHKLTCRSIDARLTAAQALDHPFLTISWDN